MAVPVTAPTVAVTVATALALGCGVEPGRGDRADGGRPCERRLRGHVLGELVPGHGGELLGLAGTQGTRRGVTTIDVRV